MSWQNAPIGSMRRDELLNALLGLWRTKNNVTGNGDRLMPREAEYIVGFEEGLDAIAQIAGLIEEFEAGKATYRARQKVKFESQVELIDGQAVLIDET